MCDSFSNPLPVTYSLVKLSNHNLYQTVYFSQDGIFNFDSANFTHSGTYYCLITNKYGHIISSNFTFIVENKNRTMSFF